MNNLIVLNGNDNVGVSQFIIPEKTKIEGHDISCLLYTSDAADD